MDPIYGLQAGGLGDLAGALSLVLMLLGAVTAGAAGWLEHHTGRPNLVTRALDRWSR